MALHLLFSSKLQEFMSAISFIFCKPAVSEISARVVEEYICSYGILKRTCEKHQQKKKHKTNICLHSIAKGPMHLVRRPTQFILKDRSKQSLTSTRGDSKSLLALSNNRWVLMQDFTLWHREVLETLTALLRPRYTQKFSLPIAVQKYTFNTHKRALNCR